MQTLDYKTFTKILKTLVFNSVLSLFTQKFVSIFQRVRQVFFTDSTVRKKSSVHKRKSLENLLLSISKLKVAGAGLEHATSRL